MRIVLSIVVLALGARAAVLAVAAVKPLAHSASQIERVLKGAQ